MKKSNLDHLLKKYVAGQVTDAEKRKIEAWLDLRKTDERDEPVLDKDDEDKLLNKIWGNLRDHDEDDRGQRRTLPLRRWLQIAASVVILAGLCGGIWLLNTKEHPPYEAVTHHSPRKIILADGTIVWLRPQSRLTYADDDLSRNATLSGAGLFEVSKDSRRPFTIHCGDVQVKVVGTSFHLKSTGPGIELKVLAGKVNISSASDTSGIDVSSKEMAHYADGEVKKQPMNSEEIRTLTTDTEYDMQFTNTPMQEVLNRIEQKFDVKIDVEDARLKRCRITVDLSDQSLEETFNMIKALLDISFTLEPGTATIHGAGCH